MFDSDRQKRRRELDNALANAINSLHGVLRSTQSWDLKLKTIQEVSKLMPFILRYLIYLKNTENERGL